MAITFEGFSSGSDFSGLALSDGDFLGMYIRQQSSNGSITTPTGWTTLHLHSAFQATYLIAYKVWRTGDPTTATTPSAHSHQGVFQYRGVDQNTPIHDESHGPVTVTADGTWIITTANNQSLSTFQFVVTGAPGYTGRFNNVVGGAGYGWFDTNGNVVSQASHPLPTITDSISPGDPPPGTTSAHMFVLQEANPGSQLAQQTVEVVVGAEPDTSEVFSESNLHIGRLGCGVNEAWIAAKCTGTRLCSLDDASRIFYDRRLDDISEAEVVIPVGGREIDACCECLGDVEPWCHELVIARDGEVVWQGPVVEVLYSYHEVVVRAKDKMAWLTVRVNEAQLDNATDNPLTDFAVEIATVAMADDGDSACFLDCIVNLGDGESLEGQPKDRIIPAFDGPTAFDQFQSVAESGVDYTVVRGCLIVGGEDFPVQPITTLLDHHILGEISVRKDGNLFANRYYVRWTGDDDMTTCTNNGALETPCPAVADSSIGHQCYGLIERVVDESLFTPSLDAAQTTADIYAEASPSVPRLIEFPDGTQLAPDTPWTVNEMIPGQRVDVALAAYCIPVNQSFRLVGMEVEDTPDGESVRISLGPINLITGLT